MSKHKSVLVLDDDEDMLRLLNRVLQTGGFMVFLASTPDRARDILEAEAPHLIISDLNMEPEDGFSFIQSVKKQAKFKDLPIIVQSALNDFNSVKKVMALGIADYVIKPVEPTSLLRKVRKALLINEFIHWEAPKDAEPHLEVFLDSQVTALGERGYHLAGPFKLTPGKEVRIKAKEFDSSEIKDYNHRSSPLMKTYIADGHFQNEVNFVRITPKGTESIKQLIQWWTQE